jgi:hypothetical protein
MKRSLALTLWGMVLVLASATALSATIIHTPLQPNVDQPVTFELLASNVTPGFQRWDFGDGTGAAGVSVVIKTYRSAGTFNVSCQYLTSAAPGPQIEHAVVTVVENRRIIYSPASPQVAQPVSFQALNFLSTHVRWDFGDGTPRVTSGTTINHTYSTPGVYQIRAWDFGGDTLTAISTSLTVGVDISRRRITCSSPGPYVGQPATLTAVDFYTNDIRWDFGDGTPAQSGSTTIVHTFAAVGDYLVQAWDWGGAYGGPTSLLVTVTEARGPRAAFSISYLQLRFEDGKAYRVVPKDLASLKAFADLKFEGTGLLRVQWLVDGAPFGAFITRALSFAEDTTVDSGDIPGLPTVLPGIHEISLRILDPAATFTIPVIRYFVSADTAVRPQDLRGVRISLESARCVTGLGCSIRAEGLEVPSGRFVILSGTVAYDLPRPVRFAVLRVHLENELIDQQFLRELRSGDRREFQTSILNPSAEPKRLYLTIYNLDPPTAELIYFQKIMLYAAGR